VFFYELEHNYKRNRVTTKMSLTRNTAIEAEVQKLIPEVNELAEYWAGTMWEEILLNWLDELVEKVRVHNYDVYPLLGKLKKKIAEARLEMEK